MKISLATNFDNSLIEKVKDMNIYEVYGKLKYDIIGGGRPDNTLVEIDKKRLESHVKKSRENNIKFNYLLNGACLSCNEQNKEWQIELKKFLDYLYSIGVEALTVTNPFILQFVKKYYNEKFSVRVSTFACVDTFEKAKYWEDIGANYICADFTRINRDFKTLKYMVNNLKKAKIEILVTNSCLKNCPMIYTHTTNLAHASNVLKNISYEDWGLFFCQGRQLTNLDEYIKSPWVRPEDIKYYEEIGIENFKITERGFPTKELVKRVKAYNERNYNGNLIDLIQGHGYLEDGLEKEEVLEKRKATTREEIYKEICRVRGLGIPRKYNRHIYIDNNKLDGFINYFIHGQCLNNCNECQYCKNIAKKVITKDDKIVNYLKELYKRYDETKM